MDPDSQGSDLVSRIALDVKALALLNPSDSRLRELLKRELLESKDESIKRFVGLLQDNRERDLRGILAVALGELVLASFLTIAGIVAFIPNLIGVSTPRGFLDYISKSVPSMGSGPLFSAIPILGFFFAALLMLGAFYTLRRAAINLRQAGLLIDPSES